MPPFFLTSDELPMRTSRCLPHSIAVLAMLATPVVTAQPAMSELDLRVTDADIQPTVTLKAYDNRTVEEYRVNNNVYMVKITPNAGAPYYLVDQDGSGDMTWNRGRPGLDLQVPQWALASW
jgi:hypothetical protein